MKKFVVIFGTMLLMLLWSSSIFAYDGYSNPIRVHLASPTTAPTVTVHYSTYQVLDKNGTETRTLGEGESTTLKEGETLSSVNGFGRFAYNKILYRGDAIYDGGFLVNRLGMETYLYSVVYKEIGGYAPNLEALKVQAVIARSYATIKLKNPRNSYYHILSTTSDQAYGGYSSEAYNTAPASVSSRIRTACRDTDGIVIYYNGTLVNAIYCANTGGYSEDAENVWGGNYPYLKGVISPWDSQSFVAENFRATSESTGTSYKAVKMSTGYQWTKTFTFDDLSNKIGGIGTITGISVSNTKSGYAKNITFTGTGGSKTLTGEKVRSALSLHSGTFTVAVGERIGAATTFSLQYLDSENFGKFLNRKNEVATFDGRGYGHSVGLSQWGACVMAYQGKTYQEILNYYYNQNQNNGKLTLEKYRG